MKITILFLTTTLIFSRYTVSALDVAKVKSELKRLLHDKDIPDHVAKFIAMLHESVDILRCVPTIREGNCYKSNVCQIPKLQVAHRPIRIVLVICKKPYKLIINFQDIDIPSWATLDLRPVVINLDDAVSGSIKVTSNTEMKLKVKHIHIGVAKAKFMINGIMRYDCTKPKDMLTRINENLPAQNKQFNLHYYRLHVRIEVKIKKIDWGKFKYHCKICEDLVNEYGVIGQGPQWCIAEAGKFSSCYQWCWGQHICQTNPEICHSCKFTCVKAIS